jgi:integrase
VIAPLNGPIPDRRSLARQAKAAAAGSSRHDRVSPEDETLAAFLAAMPALTDRRRATLAIAVNNLRRFLGRVPRLPDLNDATLAELAMWLEKRGRRRGTLQRTAADLVAIGRQAVALGRLDTLPTFIPAAEDRPPPLPWTLAELHLLLGAARTMPGLVDALPAYHWWPCLIILVLNTGRMPNNLLNLSPAAYDRKRGTLAAGPFVFALHPLAIEALERMHRADATRLLPWPLDPGGRVLHMLYREFKRLLWRAGLPIASGNLFDRLRVTALAMPGLLDRVNLQLPFTPREGEPEFTRARSKRNAARRAAELPTEPSPRAAGLPPEPSPRAAGNLPPITPPVAVYLLSPLDPKRTLLHFFETNYLPFRLAAASRGAAEDHRRAIRRLNDFTGCETVVDQLSDNLIQEFMAWLLARGLSPFAVNRYRSCLLALWSYAWRKHWVETQPRDVDKARTPKLLPRAWTVEQFGRLLTAAAETPGSVQGVPARHWWPAVLLVAFDTGARVGAILQLRCQDFDAATGFVTLRAETQKQNADQIIRLHPETVAAIRRTNPEWRDQLFPAFASKNYLIRKLREILGRAGLPSGRKDLWHRFRRTTATLMVNAVGKAATSQQLGHSDMKLLDNHYLDQTQVNRVHACDVIPRPTWTADPSAPDA